MKPLISILVTEPVVGLEETITEIPLDARISTTHNFKSRVTEFPVEEGALVTDHVHLQPDTLSIEGYVSDAPVVTIPLFAPRLKGDKGQQGSSSRSKAAFDVLMQVYRLRVPLTVVTRLQTYEDMVIESLMIPQSRDRGTGLWFTMGLRKISIIETLTAALPPDVVARLKRRRKKTQQRLKQNVLRKKYGEQKAKWIEQGNLSKKMADNESDAAAQSVVSKYFGGKRQVVEREPY